MGVADDYKHMPTTASLPGLLHLFLDQRHVVGSGCFQCGKYFPLKMISQLELLFVVLQVVYRAWYTLHVISVACFSFETEVRQKWQGQLYGQKGAITSTALKVRLIKTVLWALHKQFFGL